MVDVTLSPTLSIVIPLYQEAGNFAETLQTIIYIIKSLQVTYEIILIDDGSTDHTWQVIVCQHQQNECVKGLRLSRNFGKESALAAGLEYANGQAIIVMDGDMQHPPSLIPAMYNFWREGLDIVEAVKQSRGKENVLSRIQAKLFYQVFSRMSGYDLQGASDFKLIDRRVLEAWSSMSERNLFFRGMNAWLGFKRVKIPFDVNDRVGGKSSWSFFRLVHLALSAITSFSSAPLYLIGAVGGLFMLFSGILGVETLYNKMSGQAVDGFTTVILLMLIIGSAIMLGLVIIGAYIARIYEEVKFRPRYIVAERTEA